MQPIFKNRTGTPSGSDFVTCRWYAKAATSVGEALQHFDHELPLEMWFCSPVASSSPAPTSALEAKVTDEEIRTKRRRAAGGAVVLTSPIELLGRLAHP